MRGIGQFFLAKPAWVAVLVIAAILALPAAVWLDLRNLSDQNLRTQATTLNQLISAVRSYYATNVVANVLSGDGRTAVVHNYQATPGAIPIPATLSLELADRIRADSADIGYRFVSDYPFANRPDHHLDAFETEALRTFEASPDPAAVLVHADGTLLDREMTIATPVIMDQTCVSCHNTHPESVKRDWKVGDVRGIQTVSVRQPITLNIWSFKWTVAYLLVAGSVGLMFAAIQFQLARTFRDVNRELEANNNFLADISLKVSKYISPQIYKSIFSGERGADISTERKKLTIFFSDIKDFTATSERLQPEELTSLLNEYFTEMSDIAEQHGATVDKFIGDAIVAFFGDPTSNGVVEDARACVRMALAMQERLKSLNKEWLARGIEHPFKARIGLNTGYCNVGNFGSSTRMDYTIIGAEANLAARLETIAQPGGIVMSYETWAHCHDMVDARRLEPTRFKGVAREVVPYDIAPG